MVPLSLYIVAIVPNDAAIALWNTVPQLDVCICFRRKYIYIYYYYLIHHLLDWLFVVCCK